MQNNNKNKKTNKHLKTHQHKVGYVRKANWSEVAILALYIGLILPWGPGNISPVYKSIQPTNQWGGAMHDIALTCDQQFVCLSTGFFKLAKRQTSKLHIVGPLWGESTSDRWIPLTKGQQCGKCFHVVTSSWSVRLNVRGTWSHNNDETSNIVHPTLKQFTPQLCFYSDYIINGCIRNCLCRNPQ